MNEQESWGVWATALTASVTVNCFSAVLLFRGALGNGERMGLAAVGLLGMLMFVMAVHRCQGEQRVRDSLSKMAEGVMAAQLGARYALGTVGLMGLALAMAVDMAEAREEFWLSVLEGARTGVFVLVGLMLWRLRAGWRLLAVVSWIALDVWVFKEGVVPGVGLAWVTIVTGVLIGWLLLVVQSALDRCLDKRPGWVG